MALPSRPAQIRAVAAFLDDPRNEDRTVEQVATLIVDGIYDMWQADTESPPVPLSLGMAFSTPWSSKVMHVAWLGKFWTHTYGLRDHAWIVSADSEFGTLTPVSSPMWRVIKSSRAKAGAPGNNPNWSEGDRVLTMQNKHIYDVLATGDKCVLMRSVTNHDDIFANSNESMARFYKKG